MKKFINIIGVILIVIIAAVVLFVVKAGSDVRKRNEDQLNMSKPDDKLIGEHLYIDRSGKNPIDLNFYIPQTDAALPLVINLHGGAFVAGDADTLDSQSDRISRNWNVAVAAVNYTLMKDNITIQDAVDEVKDTVKFFCQNADKYHVDEENIFIMGYSAGGYHAMASTLQLTQEGLKIKGQILCYAFISDILEQYSALSEDAKDSMPAALFILAGDDPIGKGSLDYEAVLKSNGTETEAILYDGALHGFIEENNPEYEKLHFHDSKSPEQEKIARDAEVRIGTWLLARTQK